MLYKFDSNQLVYRKAKRWNLSYLLLGTLVIGFVLLNISARDDGKITEDKIMVILAEGNKFSSEKLVSKIKEMNFQYPYIIYGQALLETDHFRSRIFKENNNIFGMKEATRRINLSRGSQYDHAWYANWMDSLYDYGLFYASYLSRISTEEQYYSFLDEYYSEDPDYVVKLQQIIEQEDLKSLFN